ncbi:MAG: septum formation initiator family protein [Candidatus Moranbacteria bacterium]|jgi:cell division protein FtsB|nr:septum formation initiator family protein [Candidatus Moranbacteria bacterium]MDD5652154.1 septum formation initiator family protein [Candidatus Moranbacteria bacterium]MDX9856054.1 septum formation initiator family protein [Candidatus Moranbacteria bacterium]
MNRIYAEKKGNVKFGFAKIKILIAVFGLIICVGYLGVINISAVKGYEIRKVEKEIEDLRKENKKLQIEAAELNSSYNIENEAQNLNMVKAEDVVYISESGQAVAIRE